VRRQPSSQVATRSWRWLSAAATLRELYGFERVKIIRGKMESHLPQVLEILGKSKAAALIGHHAIGEQLKEKGVRIPEDIGYVTYDCVDTEASQTSIIQPHYEIGRRAIRYLSTLVEQGRWGIPESACRLTLECGWQEGGTLPLR